MLKIMWRHELINQEMTFWEVENLTENTAASVEPEEGVQNWLLEEKESHPFGKY